MAKEIRIKDIKIGSGNSLVLIAGPCVIESRETCLKSARVLKELTARLKVPFIFKSSYDKANRTSVSSYRGPGLRNGLAILQEVKEKLGLAILSDVHCKEDLANAAKVLDIIQIPAFLCRQTDMLVRAGLTSKIINIKKGQFLAPWDIGPIIKKIESTGNRKIMITERGVSFGYNNLVSDLRALPILRDFGYPVIYDATHSVQLPSGKGVCSGGERRFVSGLCRAAVAFGCDGLFLEVHPEPDKALCDGPNMISFQDLEALLKQVKKIEQSLRGSAS